MHIQSDSAQNVCDIDGHAGGVGKSVVHNSVGMNAHERKCLRCSWSLGHRVATSSSWTRGVDNGKVLQQRRKWANPLIRICRTEVGAGWWCLALPLVM